MINICTEAVYVSSIIDMQYCTVQKKLDPFNLPTETHCSVQSYESWQRNRSVL